MLVLRRAHEAGFFVLLGADELELLDEARVALDLLVDAVGGH